MLTQIRNLKSRSQRAAVLVMCCAVMSLTTTNSLTQDSVITKESVKKVLHGRASVKRRADKPVIEKIPAQGCILDTPFMDYWDDEFECV